MGTTKLDVGLKGRDLLSLADLNSAEVGRILEVAFELKRMQRQGEPHQLLPGKILAMIFQKHSTRTRVSFEAGMYQLGGRPMFLSGSELQLGRGESIADTARVLARYVDGIVIRTYEQQEVEELARFADVPVINALTDAFHPCQVLADLLTIQEKKQRLAGLELGYVGDGNNVAHSLLHGAALVGMNITVATPPGYEPKATVVEEARRIAKSEAERRGWPKPAINITDDPLLAARNADILYTDVWASMGQEGEQAERQRAFARYQLNADLLKLAKPDCMVMHCLPAHRGEEITDEVIEGPQSVVFDQAENRLHAQKALLALVM
ncbi:MAG: ornithine carbamoyltransferase [Clostridia bacterium]|nr:ornithine carbamoyltransferase [Clostridia bacterium]